MYYARSPVKKRGAVHDSPRVRKRRHVFGPHVEVLEDRTAPAVVTYTQSTGLLDFTADAGETDNVAVTAPAANQVQIVVGNGDSITLAGDALANPDFVLSTTTNPNDTLTIDTAAGHAPAANFNLNLGDQDDTLAFGLGVTPNGVSNVAIDGGTGADTLMLNATSITGSLTASAETLTVNEDVAVAATSQISASDGTANGNNVVTIRNFTAGRAIDLGTNTTLGLTDAELDRIAAETLRIGRNDASASGPITVSAAIDLTVGA